MAYRPQSRGCVKLVDVEGWFDDDDDGAGGGDDDNYDDDADVLLSSTKVCLPIPYTIRPKTLPHKMTRQPRVHTNPNAKTAEPSKRLINKTQSFRHIQISDSSRENVLSKNGSASVRNKNAQTEWKMLQLK